MNPGPRCVVSQYLPTYLSDHDSFAHSQPSAASKQCAEPVYMARKRRTDSGSTTGSMTGPRRRSTLRDLQASASSDGDVIKPKIINAAPSLEKAEMYGIDDLRPASSKIMAMAGRIFIETIPQWLAVGGMMGLIFGGCCSNVSDHSACWALRREAHDQS
jgi:hypothetical protein